MNGQPWGWTHTQTLKHINGYNDFTVNLVILTRRKFYQVTQNCKGFIAFSEIAKMNLH